MSEPFEVWREPEGMADVIASVVGRLGLGGAPVAMITTAELVAVRPLAEACRERDLLAPTAGRPNR